MARPYSRRNGYHVELKIAVEEGYVIENIRYFFEFKRSKSFFHAYMRHFIRMKVESECYAKLSDSQLDVFINIYAK